MHTNFARRCVLVATCATLAACTHPGPAADTAAAATPSGPSQWPLQRPNVLLIVADDLGYSDLGAFGSEIPTPHLDALAAHARLLGSHYVAPTCSPTRAMLMSGTDNHQAGLGSMAELIVRTPPMQGRSGYEGYLNDRVAWLPQALRDAGYHTYMAGKWHLGNRDPKTWPAGRGFESSFALLPGGGPHFAPVPGKPVGGDQVPYVEDGQPTRVPEDFYSSDFFTTRLMSYLQRSAGDGKPFFAYLAFTAPHWPLQAPDADIARFAGRYDAGYAVVRDGRLARQKALGWLPPDFVPSSLPASPDFPRWEQLTPAQQRSEARKMEVYAAMVHNMDRNVGRLLDYLKSTGQYDNTLVLFMSDNGAEATPSFFPDTPHTDNSLANMGRRLSNIGYGPRWAEVSATPLRYFKGYTSEGGISAPAMVRLPGQNTAMPRVTQATHVTDLAPTILELAGVAQPQGVYAGRTLVPMTGTSLVPLLRGEAVSPALAGRVVGGELFGGRYIRSGPWKLVSVRNPFSDNRWELYDVSTDRGETRDLSAQRPDIVARLQAEWDRYAREQGVVLLQPPMPQVRFGATGSGLAGAGGAP